MKTFNIQVWLKQQMSNMLDIPVTLIYLGKNQQL